MKTKRCTYSIPRQSLPVTSWLLILCMTWSFIVSPCATAAHSQLHMPRPHTSRASQTLVEKAKLWAKRVATDQKYAQKPGFPYRQAMLWRRSVTRRLPQSVQNTVVPKTLLDEVGLLTCPVPTAEALSWSRELIAGRPVASRAALLHLWLGEWQLAHNQQPRTAKHHFKVVQSLTKPTEPLYGLAAYDLATATYYEGAYAEAVTDFKSLMVAKPRLSGFDRRYAALWMRHAGACAGYHADRANAGIPEPPRLDPLCGAASLAASLQAAGHPYSQKTILSIMHVTGEGSSMADIVSAAQHLGLSARTVRADDQGLILLPKPLVAYVEHDHFVSVVHADKKGVSYLCSDCGAWPGGRVDLTWKQWHLLNGGLYVALTVPGTVSDQEMTELDKNADRLYPPVNQNTLSSSFLGKDGLAHVLDRPALLAYTGDLTQLHLSLQFHLLGNSYLDLGTKLSLHFSHLRGHVVLTHNSQTGAYCGAKPGSQHCVPPTCCPLGNVGLGGGDLGPPPDGPVGSPISTGPQPGGGLQAHNYDHNGLLVPASVHQCDDRKVARCGVEEHPGLPHKMNMLGATLGDPVNLATGEEEYKPIPDLVVYNPHGPSVTWARYYNSLRRPGQGYVGDSTGDANYEMNDFGVGWSRSYNVGVYDPTSGGTGSSATKYVFYQNGGRQPFTAPSTPTASTPQILCTTPNGCPFLVYWDYAATGNYYTIVHSDRTRWVTTAAIQGLSTCYALAQIIDRNGHSISFNYTPAPAGTTFSWPLLSSIVNEDGTTLLNIVRVGDSSGNIAEVDDCYKRSVLYHVSNYAVYSGAPQYTGKVFYAELDHVSQLSPLGTPNPADLYVYGYENMGYGYAFLHTISVPNPAGGAVVSKATIDYDPSTYFVTQITDANANITSFASVSVSGTTGSGTPGSTGAPSGTLTVNGSGVPTDYTQVTISGGGATYSSIHGYDMNMSGATTTDGTGNVIASSIFDASSMDIFRPTSSTNGDGTTTHFVWDPFGNKLQMTDGRGMVTNYKYGYPAATFTQYPALSSLPNTSLKSDAFAMGELLSIQEIGSQGTAKAPVTYAYLEPSGLISQITSPMPGYIGSGSPTVTTSFVYDNYGNRDQIVFPGNDTVASRTISSFYGTGTNIRIGQPLTVTGSAGQKQFTYDTQGNRTSVTDALGNTTYYGNANGQNGYNIANQCVLITCPKTSQTGTGNSSVVLTYLYPGGPKIATQTYDESGQLAREVDTLYGPEGEVRRVSGSIEPVQYIYDGRYHLTAITDGAGNATHYFYNNQGYLYQVAYPGSGATSQAKPAGTLDTTTYVSYDTAGHLLSRIDGNGVATNYTYSDPLNYLTKTTYVYPSSYVGIKKASINITYDQFGRLISANDGTTGETHGYTDASNVVHPGYDDNDTALNTQTTYYNATGSRLFTATVSYTFNADRSRRTLTTPAGSFSYSHDGAGRLSSLTNPAGETYQWVYRGNNWLQTQTLANGATTTYSQNALGEVVDQQTAIGGSSLVDFGSQTHDAAGNLTSEVATLVTQPSYSGSKSYSYDSRDDLVQEGSIRYGYDGLTNGTTTGSANPTLMRGLTQTFSGDGDNKLTGLNGNTSFTYDGNGSPTVFASQPLTFDPENHMTSCNGLQSGYTTTGRRAVKSIGGNFTYFLYDGSQIVCELNANGTVVAINTFGSYGLVARNSNASSTQYVFDAQGNVSQRLSSTGGVVSTDTYDAYGQQRTTATVPDPFGFGAKFGYYTDAETGLVLLGDRFYNPSSGRFMTRDAIGYKGGVNVYNYVANNPINRSDSTGYQGVIIGTLPPTFGPPVEAGPVEGGPVFDPRPVLDGQGPPSPSPTSPSPTSPTSPNYPLPVPSPGVPIPPSPPDYGGDYDECKPDCTPDPSFPPESLGDGTIACYYRCVTSTGETYQETAIAPEEEGCPDLSNPEPDPPPPYETIC